METAGLYLLRSAVWITGFALVYLLFLRNERFFLLNRIYLIIGIIASVVLPLVTVRYVVEVSAVEAAAEAGPVTAILNDGGAWQSILAVALFALWLAGAGTMLFRYVLQVLPVLRAAGEADRVSGYPVKLLRLPEFSSSFSLFSYVIVNPSVTETEAREILNHEMVHIRQRHWFDLVLSSILCAVQWFNPAAWIYSRFIRQNHEYLADEEALQRSSDPAVYRAVLINQIAGSPVIDLGNFFSYSLNKKRFQMMKNTISSPWRKLRLLLILPVAALVLYAFAEPEYTVAAGGQGQAVSAAATADITKTVSGVVTNEKGSPLEGAVIVIQGTMVGTTTDASGRFTLKNVPDDATLVVSYVGYVTKAILAKAVGNNLTIKLDLGTFVTDTVSVVPPPPPPPPSGVSARSSGSGPFKGLVVLDGKVTDKPLSEISPDIIAEIRVLKDDKAVAVYGEKGRDGVIEITTKKSVAEVSDKPKEVTVTGYGKEVNKEVFVVVEEMPEFPGGNEALMTWVAQHVKYPEQAAKNGIMGMVMVSFVVEKTGKVGSVKIERSVDPLLDDEAKRVISELPDFKPGSQRGKNVDVQMTIPVKFSLK